MSAPHINDDLLDQYALGSLGEEVLAGVEEHLLICQHCRGRLAAADEFIGLFRAAATQPDARPRPIWQRLFHVRTLTWASAAAIVATVLFFVSVESRKPPIMPATVYMKALRGPEAPLAITAGKPARLVFDLLPSGAPRDYEVQIVNLLGAKVLVPPAESSDGHLSTLVEKLDLGSYWVRIYHKTSGDLVAEYGLRAER